MIDERAAYELIARMGGALASPVRLRLLNLLSQGPRTVEALAEAADEPIGTVSHHLRRLDQAGLVMSSRRGRFVMYRVACAEACALWVALKKLAAQQLPELRSEVEELRRARERHGHVTRDELMDLVRSERITLIDVRPPEEYHAGHLPGAVSVPVDRLVDDLQKLPKDRPVVAYCRGAYCRLADEAVDELERAGYRAWRFEDGVVEWEAGGLEVERNGPEG